MNLPSSAATTAQDGSSGTPVLAPTPKPSGSLNVPRYSSRATSPVNLAPTSAPTSAPRSRSTSVTAMLSQAGQSSMLQEVPLEAGLPLQIFSSPVTLPRSAMSEVAKLHRMSERSPSPSTRTSQTAMAEVMAQNGNGKSPGLLRRFSQGARGAHNRLRRRASSQQVRSLRDQSAGPVLTRRRSDSNNDNTGSDFDQDMSDLELTATVEDIHEEPPYPARLPLRHNGLGISVPRASDASTNFEGGLAEADSSTLQVGTDLIKLTKKRKKKVRLWLDSTSARVCWYGKASTKSFGLDDVVEVRKGADSRNARDDVQVSLEDEQRLLTIVYVDERSRGRGTRTMHLLMPDMHIMDLWLKAVNQVVAERVASMKALSLSSDKSEKGVTLFWRQAMQLKAPDAEELFTYEDARKFCRQLQINCHVRTVEARFLMADVDKKKGLTFPQYKQFVNSFKERKDIAHLHRNIKHGLDSDLEMNEFFSFLKNDQAIDVDKDRAHWETIFDKYARPAQNRTPAHDTNPVQKTLGQQGLLNFLMSNHNSPLVPTKAEATLDRPLNEYFISSSHNTYLLGHQVRGTSSVEGYIDALIGGCRCVEIDCWDGDNGRPMVTHGRTMTTKIPFEDCVSVIAKYAFHSSPYPLIISLEVHCSAEQQGTMVDLMHKHFDGMMVTEPIVPSANSLPSPEELRGKILVKVKASDDTDQSQLLADASNGRSRARSLSSAFARSPSAEKVMTSPMLPSPGTASPSEPGVGSISTPRGSTTSGPTMTPSSSAEESDEGSVSANKTEPPRTSKIVPKLGRLGVYTQGISFPKALGFSDPRAKAFNHILSFSEDTFESHCKKEGGNRQLLEKHNVHYLMRVYPGRRRIWSSNFNPLAVWRRGVQMAATNWQTYDVHQQVNRAMFAAGSDCLGYVLKPDELRHAKHLPIADTIAEAAEKKEKKGKKIVKFAVDIISAQRLPRPRNADREAGMNPYIEFEMYAADDKAQGNATGEGGTDASAPDGSSGVGSPLRKRTRVVPGNGFDPSFDEQMSMAVVTRHPSLIFVRWTVWHQPDGRKPTSTSNVQLATFTAKLSSLQQGYRHLPLFNPQGEKYQEAKLFVKIKKEAPIPAHEEDPAYGIMEPSASPRPEVVRADRSWPRRIFSRNPSERRRRDNESEQRGMLSRTSSMERESMR